MLSLVRKIGSPRKISQFRTHYDRTQQFTKTMAKIHGDKVPGSFSDVVIKTPEKLKSPETVDQSKTIEKKSQDPKDVSVSETRHSEPDSIGSHSSKSSTDAKLNASQKFLLDYHQNLVATAILMIACVGRNDYSRNHFRYVSGYDDYGIVPYRKDIFEFVNWNEYGSNIIKIDMNQKELSYYKQKLEDVDNFKLKLLLYQLTLYARNHKNDNHLVYIQLLIDYFEKHLNAKQ
jgi:hypothetical protein